jgi:hypothetical protein
MTSFIEGVEMPFIIGITLALVVGVFTTSVGWDRDRALYPVVLLVVASYYVLFAVMGGSTTALIVDSIVMLAFVLVAVWGFKSTLWLVVAGLAGHGVLDAFHHGVVANPGVPAWWPPFCLGYDVAAAAVLGWLLTAGSRQARSVTRA